MTTKTHESLDNGEGVGPLSLRLHQEVWIVVNETPHKLFVKSHSNRLGKYILAQKRVEPCFPYFSLPEDLHLDEKSAWIAVKSLIIGARQSLDNKLEIISQRIAKFSHS